jgi:mycofactocin precursor
VPESELCTGIYGRVPSEGAEMPESAVLLDQPAAVTAVDAAAGAPMGQQPAAQGAAAGQASPPAEVLAADLLVEEISIDGMCGVY